MSIEYVSTEDYRGYEKLNFLDNGNFEEAHKNDGV